MQQQMIQPDPAAPGLGAVFFSYGFRPFFLGAAVWAALAMMLWVAMLAGALEATMRFDPVSWHAHEFLFGYLGAVIGGFMLTAVPSWTGRPVLRGAPLGLLAGLWLAGRLAVGFSAGVPPFLVAALDLSFASVLAGLMTVDIVAAGNRRNFVVVAMLVLFVAANAVFHWENMQGYYPAQGAGLRLGLAVGIALIALIGGRIVPAFTRNWLTRRGATRLPVPPMQRFDVVALLALAVALLGWVIWPESPAAAVALLGAGALHLWRLKRWQGVQTGAEPLVWVLHLAYLFVPLGALAQGAAILRPEALSPATAQHLWTAGAIGLMTLAVMSRASLGHTGRALRAGAGTTLLYLCLVASVIARLLVDLLPEAAALLQSASGLFWIVGFGGFALLYGPMMLRPRED